MNYDLIVTKVDESYIRIDSDDQGVIEDIHEKFSFLIKNHRFDPRVVSGKWNGIKHLFNKRNRHLEAGLLLDLIDFCEQRKYNFKVDQNLFDQDSISIEDLEHIVEDVIQPKNKQGELIKPYDYQYAALQYQLSMNRSVSIAATSSGKSLVAYLALRIYQMMSDNASKRMMLVVPTKNLVEQMFNDFKEYAQDTDWSVDQHVQKVNSDYTKFVEKNINISTWQSASKLESEFFDELSVLIVDEVHCSEAAILNSMVKSCRRTAIRHGLTGTLDDWDCHEYSIKGIFGPIKKFVTAKELIEKGRATEVRVNMVLLKHTESDCLALSELISATKSKNRYLLEAKFIASLKSRQRLLYEMFLSAKGNTLILFDLKEDYGVPLYEGFKEIYEHTHLITGDVESDDRNDIKQILESATEKQVLFASFKTMSVGESIKNLHNLFIVSSKKSKIAVLQALGRLMRLHASKNHSNLYDIVDDLSYKDNHNFSYKHSFDRLGYYDREGHKIDFLKFEMKKYV